MNTDNILLAFFVIGMAFIVGLVVGHYVDGLDNKPFIQECNTIHKIEAVYILDSNESFYCDGTLTPIILEEPLPSGIIS